MSMDFTQPQQQAIDIRDRSLLVSAGAGAGKTRTLIERLYGLLTGPNPCSIDELLVVTFTRSAAQEMRTRLQKRLTLAMLECPPESPERGRLQEQLVALPRAHISTIHSFCLQILTEHAEKIGLPPTFQLMSTGEETLLQGDFLRRRLDELMANGGPDADAVRRLLRYNRVTSAIPDVLEWVSSFHSFLGALPDPAGWIERWGHAGCWRPDEPRCQELFQNRIRALLGSLLTSFAEFRAFERRPLADHLRKQLDLVLERGDQIQSALDLAATLPSLEELHELLSLPRGGSPRNFAHSPDDEDFKERRSDLVSKLGSAREELKALAGFSEMRVTPESAEVIRVFGQVMGLQWSRELFEEQMTAGRLTFGHLERLAHRLLIDPQGQPTELALQYRQGFRHVLVDEFQDVNQLQESILRAVSRPPTECGGGNLFVVGDVKQSIYEFRQAEPTLFLDLYSRSKDLAEAAPTDDVRISLQHNFRTDSRLLECFNGLFSRLMLPGTLGIDYARDHTLIAGRQDEAEREVEFTVSILEEDDALDENWSDFVTAEAAYVAKRVREIGPPWRDICILLRAGRWRVTELTEALNQAGIPVYTNNRTGFLSAVEVIEFRSILRTIDNPWLDVELLATLRGPAFRWSDNDLLRLRAVDRDAFFFNNLLSLSLDTSSELQRAASEAVSAISRWQSLAANLPMTELFAHLFDELSLLEIAAARPGGEQRRRNLEALLDRASEYDGFQRKGLARFLDYLEQLIAEGKDLATPAVIPDDADMVSIMTIHASKGMEFPVVVMPYLGSTFNNAGRSKPILWDRMTGMATGIGLDPDVMKGDSPEVLPYRLLQNERRRRETCEELRLLYVALTRARDSIHLIGSVAEQNLERLEMLGEQSPNSGTVLAASSYAQWVLPWAMQAFGSGSHEALDVRRVAPQEQFTLADDNRALARLVRSGACPAQVVGRRARAKWFEDSKLRQDETPGQETSVSLGPGHAEALERVQELKGRPEPPLLRAKLSVSEAKRVWDATLDPETPRLERPAASASSDWVPARLRTEATAGPIEGTKLGTLTHRFLANLQFDPAGKSLFFRAELARQTREGILTEREAAAIRVEGITWFFGTPVGAEVVRHRAVLQRERPFTALVAGERLHPGAEGRSMILQGVLDLLYRTPQGWVIVDYKTDFADSEERLEQLVAAYSLQMRLYRLLVEETLREPVVAAWLVFLRAQRLVEVTNLEEVVRWEDVLAKGAVVFPEASDSEPTLRWI